MISTTLTTIPLMALIAVVAALAMTVGDTNAQPTSIDAGSNYFCSQSFENGICDTTVTAGSTVTWQVSAGFHNVTECDASFTTCPTSGGFESGLLQNGQTFSYTFDTAGTYPYNCTFHPDQMSGRILVQAQATPTPAPTAPTAAGSATPQPTVVNHIGLTPTPGGVPSGGGSDSPASGGPVPTALIVLGIVSLAVAGASALALRRTRA